MAITCKIFGHKWNSDKRCSRCGEEKPIRFPLFTGSGVCDVCNNPLTKGNAYQISNSLFYGSKKYRDWYCNNPLSQLMFGNATRAQKEAMLDMQAARDTSPGSAICKKCIDMFE